jgi:dTDP-D-glucose 4,6-dehydratase
MVLRRHPATRVVNLDKLTYAGNLDNLHDVQDNPRYEFILGDIRDKALVRRVFARVQGVVHFAAETHVDRSIYDAGEFVLSNVHGTYTLLDALRAFPAVEFFIHVSTDEVYGSRTGRAALDAARELIQFVPDRPGHDRRYAMDSGLIRALGWEPETPFAEGLKKTVRWYASNRSWWRKVRTRSL